MSNNNYVSIPGSILAAGSATSDLQAAGNAPLSSLDAKLTLIIDTLEASDAVTDAQLRASPIPVSGVFFQATQPVSLALAPTTPVTGTFWQATQPVSGSFFQATQPVSLAVAPTTPVTGTFWQATQPVSGTFFQATQPISGTVTANAGTGTMAVSLAVAPTTPVTGTFWQATQPVSGTVTVTPPTLTKGTQGATGFSTQDLKDAGRNQTNFFMAIQIVTTGTDALLALTGYKSGATVGATATPAVVTAGKTYRITSVTMSYTTIITTPGSVRFTLRANLSGTVLIGSPAVCNWEVGEPTGIAPVAGKKNTVHLTFPDGMEFAAGTGIGISQVGLNTVGAAAAVGYGQITLHGYEY